MRSVSKRSRAVLGLCLVAALLAANVATAGIRADLPAGDPAATGPAQPGQEQPRFTFTFRDLLFVIRLFSHLSIPGG